MSDSPISLRDETGIERFRGTQSPGGGSTPYEHIVVPLAWDTPGFVIPASGPVGIKITDLAPGDAPLGVPGSGLGFFSVSEAWDGSTPTLETVLTAGRGDLPGTPPSNAVPSAQLSFVSSANPMADPGTPEIVDCQGEGLATAALVMRATALWAYYDDAAGNDPGSSMGQGEYHLFIARATP